MLLKLATMSSGARIDRFCTRVPSSIYTRPLYSTKLLARVHDTHGSASQCVAHQPAHLPRTHAPDVPCDAEPDQDGYDSEDLGTPGAQ